MSEMDLESVIALNNLEASREEKKKAMKITIIGSTSYQEKFKEHAKELTDAGHEVMVPAFDNHPELDELGICAYNLMLIEQADEVHVIWDQRSTGTIFDLGMCFALRKPVKITYLNPKTFTNFLTKYVSFCDFVSNMTPEELAEMAKGGAVPTPEAVNAVA